MMKAKLIAVTQPVVEGIENAKELIVFCARVSNPSNQMNMETADKLLAYLLKYKHFSPLEMANAVVEVEVPRDIGRQLLRHGSFKFQEFCIAGESMITMVNKGGNSYKISIEDLYKRQNSVYHSRCTASARHYNESTGLLEAAKIKEVFDTGVKPCFKMTLETSLTNNGKSIIATADHKFLTSQGWKRLGDIKVGDFVAENGIPVHQNAEWLAKAKATAIETKTGVQGIAEMAGVSYHTIRKWLRIHSLQFTHNEVKTYTEIWNKGLPSAQQPKYRKPHSEESRDKMRTSSTKGSLSNFYTGGGWCVEEKPFRKVVVAWARGFLMSLLESQGYKCNITGVPLTMANAVVDHIQPVYAFPEKALDNTNLQALSYDAHLVKSLKEAKESRLTVSYKSVNRIESVGEVQTYDMEIDAESHNYVANGIVTHNSQRYADVTQLDNAFCLRDLRLQDTKNRQNSIEVEDDEESRFMVSEWKRRQEEILDIVQDSYKWAIDCGIAKEVARVILPEGLTMSRMYVNGTIRSWLHYLQVRLEEGVTQQEHVMLARLIAEQVNAAFPVAEETWNG